MSLSLDSKVKEVMRSEAGKAVMVKYIPTFATSPKMKLVGSLTLRKLLSYPESAEYAVYAEDIDRDLKALG